VDLHGLTYPGGAVATDTRLRTGALNPQAYAGPIAAALAVLTVVWFGAGSGLAGAVPASHLPAGLKPVASSWWFRLTPLYGQTFAVVGAFIVWRRPGNRVGWIALAIGVLWAMYQLATGYVVYGYSGHGQLPANAAADFLVTWEWVVPTVLMLFTLPFFFPDGRPPSARWTPVHRAVLVAMCAGALGAVVLPAAAPVPKGVVNGFSVFFQFLLVVCAVLAPASLVARYRSAGIEVRQQLKWFASAYVLLAAVSVSGFAINATLLHAPALSFTPVFEVLIPIAMMCVALSVAVAIFKYHLYDIDLFIRRTLVYGALLALIGVLYLVLVVTVGTRLGVARENNPAIPFVIAAVIAIAFQPLRTRLTRLANRIVYGKRATPYEVLSRFGEQVSSMYASDELPLRIARALAEGSDADRAEVWLHVGDELRAAAVWPPRSEPRSSITGANGAMPQIPETAAQAPVVYQEDLLGVLALVKREPVTPVEHRLLDDLARQASVVLKNVRLTAELQDRLRELQESRRRLVTAQDEERRRLERDLHDGAQQNLVALKIELGLARTLAAKDPANVGPLLEKLSADADEAVQVLRRFSHGIYPPILADRGLEAALQAHARLVTVRTEVCVRGTLPRLARQVESAVYFCVLEALQNVVKHAAATRAVVELRCEGGRLQFAVSDDGRGVDSERMRAGAGMQNMLDRVAAVGGALGVCAVAPHGARIEGWVPADQPGAITP
jgi:signal transduction histidine kinase